MQWISKTVRCYDFFLYITLSYNKLMKNTQRNEVRFLAGYDKVNKTAYIDFN